MGEYFYQYKLKKFQKYLIILFALIMELLYGIFAFWFFYLSIKSVIADLLFSETAVHNTMDYLFRIFHLCIFLTATFNKFTNLFRGHHIIIILNNISSNINLSNSHRIFHYRLIYLVIIFIMILNAISFGLFQSIVENYSRQFMFGFGIAGIIYANNAVWVTAIHIYTAILVNERIQIYKEQLPKFSNYGILLQEMIRLSDNIRQINRLLSAAMLTKTLTNVLMMATCICTLDHQLNTAKIDWSSMISPMADLFAMFIDLLVSCMASQWMHKEMGDFVCTIQERIALASIHPIHYKNYQKSYPEKKQSINSDQNNMIMNGLRPIVNDGEYHCLEQICMMHDSFYFTVMDMFDLKNSFMLSLASYVLSNAILLIQTKDSSINILNNSNSLII
ncbi:uncharacterized protein LOC142645999 [Dermatophagoides pteronyssinus]|uniref:uncharacterized protein LOC142645999 n=1 Tax=Dermatophagoides pteronyssinus TaxID=6956 RepID=UPI003F67DF1A